MEVVSLLPYLQPGISRFYLRLQRVRPAGEGGAVGDPGDFPFVSWWDGDPYTKILKADLVAGPGYPIVTLYLFLQRDRYRAAGGGGIGNNVDMERAWRRSLGSVGGNDDWPGECSPGSGPAGNTRPVAFGAPDPATGRLSPLAPMLYCRQADRFFHLFCPRCGRVFDLCRDDNILEQSGLESYSTTLTRYLYCPVCHESRFGSPFYRRTDDAEGAGAARRAADLVPNVAVKTQYDLIDQYIQLPVPDMKAQEDFPCPACSWKDECYGTAPQLARRVAFFSFYPFWAAAFRSLPEPGRWPLVAVAPGQREAAMDGGAKVVTDPGGTVQAADAERDRAIRAMLRRIRVRWSGGGDRGETVPDRVGEEVTGETVLLVDRVDETRGPGVEAVGDADDLEETVILGAGAVGDQALEDGVRAQAPPDEEPSADDFLDETVVLGASGPAAEDIPVGLGSGNAELDETVVLDESGGVHGASQPPHAGEPDEPPETIIVRPKPKKD